MIVWRTRVFPSAPAGQCRWRTQSCGTFPAGPGVGWLSGWCCGGSSGGPVTIRFDR